MKIHLIRFIFLRMSRNFIGMLLLIVVPLVLISVLGLVTNYITDDQYGRPAMDWIAVSFVLAFQLFSGAYTMSYMKEDLFDSRKWKIYSLPLSPHGYSNLILIACTLYSLLQGLVLILFTKFVYGVDWGNLGWVLLVVFAVAMLSQIVCQIFAFTFKNFKLAERMSEVYGIGSMVLAGMIFGLPSNGFLDFMGTYGNPVSLGQNAIFGMIDGTDTSLVWISLGILFAGSVILYPVAAALGRRKIRT